MIEFKELLKKNKAGVVCMSEKDAKFLLKELHKKGYKWNGGNDLLEIFRFKAPCYFYYINNNDLFCNKKLITHSSSGTNDCNFYIEFKDVIFENKNNKQNYAINKYTNEELINICEKYKNKYDKINTIEFHKNKTIVTLIGNNKGVSTCLPTDKFDIDNGIILAYERALREYENKIYLQSIEEVKQLEKEIKDLKEENELSQPCKAGDRFEEEYEKSDCRNPGFPTLIKVKNKLQLIKINNKLVLININNFQHGVSLNYEELTRKNILNTLNTPYKKVEYLGNFK